MGTKQIGNINGTYISITPGDISSAEGYATVVVSHKHVGAKGATCPHRSSGHAPVCRTILRCITAHREPRTSQMQSPRDPRYSNQYTFGRYRLLLVTNCEPRTFNLARARDRAKTAQNTPTPRLPLVQATIAVHIYIVSEAAHLVTLYASPQNLTLTKKRKG